MNIFYWRAFLSSLIFFSFLVVPSTSLADGQFDPVKDASELHAAMKTWISASWVDKDTVYRILKNRTPAQIREIEREFDDLYNSSWDNTLKSALETSFRGNDRILALSLLHNINVDLELVEDAVDGIESGVVPDIDLFTSLMQARSRDEIREIKDKFQTTYGKSLRQAIIENFSGDEQEQALRYVDGQIGSDGRSLPPLLISTEGQTCDQTAPPAIWRGGYWANDPPLLPCWGLGCTVCGWCGIMILAQRIFYFLMSVVIYMVVPVRILYGGGQILLAGTVGSLSKGKDIVLQTVVGVLLILGAFLIMQTFLWLLGNPDDVKWPNFACPIEIVPTPRVSGPAT